jgi:2-keto-myo-inositol isomerase
MKPCMNQYSIMQCDIEEFIEVCADVGFRELELRDSKVEAYLVDHSHKELRGLLRKHGIHVATLNSLEYFSLVPEENFDFMLKKAEYMMTLCQLIDCDTLVSVPSKNPQHLPLSEIKPRTVERLQGLADLGNRYGVKVLFEPIGFDFFSIRKHLDGLDIVKEIKNQEVGLLIDTFHFHVGQNTLDDLGKIPGERISLIHFHDAADRPRDKLRDEDRLYPGEGVIDLDGFCGVLRDKGYEGVLSVELINPKLWETMSPKDMAIKAWDSLRPYLQ